MKRRLEQDEIDDVVGAKPEPMDEEYVMDVLKGNKFSFTLPHYEEYMVESRKVVEEILKANEFNL